MTSASWGASVNLRCVFNFGPYDKPGVFGIFDTFDDEAGREAHLNGEIAKALMAKADEYFAEKPIIHKITLIAEK